MGSLDKLFKAKAELESARNLYNYAGLKLELAEIKCRYADFVSSYEPLNGMLEKIACSTTISREQLLEVVDYVLLGRSNRSDGKEV